MTRPKSRLGSSRRVRRAPFGTAVLRIELDRTDSSSPLYAQIRDHVRRGVADGTLPDGVRLPPERYLATALGVSRSTVMRAYQELVADGLIEAVRSRGSVVTKRPELRGDDPLGTRSWTSTLPPLTALGSDSGLLRQIVSAGTQGDVISFASSAPPRDLLPTSAIGLCIQEELERQGPRLLSYGPVEGLPELRELLTARMVGSAGVTGGNSVVVLSGSTQGLALAARVLIEKGDEVIVEAPTYLGIIQSLELAGARLIGVAVDDDGIRTEAVADVLAHRRIRLIVLQPNFQNPTGVSLSPERREEILFLAKRYGVPILEDDAYGALYHNTPPPGTLKQIDRYGFVIYLSSFSKTLAPGLRVAWMWGPDDVMARIALSKQFSDLNTNAIGQAVVARLLMTGQFDANLEHLRQTIKERMGVMTRELDKMTDVLGPGIAPKGGLHMWRRLRVGDSATAVIAAARAGVAILAGTAFYPGGTHPSAGQDQIRLSLPTSGVSSIGAGARKLAGALRQLPTVNRGGGDRQMNVVVV